MPGDNGSGDNELRKPSFASSSSGELDTHTSATAVDYLETMVDGAFGRLQRDRHGNYTYCGHYGGLTLLERVHACCRQLKPGLAEDPTSDIKQIFDQSMPLSRLSTPQWCLPDISVAKGLSAVALNDAGCLMTFVDAPTFDRMLERIYSVEEDMYSDADLRFLTLLYAALVVGTIFLQSI